MPRCYPRANSRSRRKGPPTPGPILICLGGTSKLCQSRPEPLGDREEGFFVTSGNSTPLVLYTVPDPSVLTYRTNTVALGPVSPPNIFLIVDWKEGIWAMISGPPEENHRGCNDMARSFELARATHAWGDSVISARRDPNDPTRVPLAIQERLMATFKSLEGANNGPNPELRDWLDAAPICHVTGCYLSLYGHFAVWRLSVKFGNGEKPYRNHYVTGDSNGHVGQRVTGQRPRPYGDPSGTVSEFFSQEKSIKFLATLDD
ncbi:hypothetical protein DFH94DRAFT_686666 [Russula ochroleuca]|uniref:Uncharacterized protein n=1 Tax=Russula ochroleuca TaxID=152965 RepID=A0A9P5MPE7_9AGAM|nr:hypothetical protein DFH94DRAFT_686666 [Russula ochroleuca]